MVYSSYDALVYLFLPIKSMDEGLNQHVDKRELLDRLDREYRRFRLAIAPLTPRQLQTPGVVGDWSIKDVIAHFITHEQFALEELRCACHGEQFQGDTGDSDTMNERAVAAQRQMALDDVLRAWDHSYSQVVAAVTSLSDADFDPAGPTARALDDTIDGALGNNTYGHYAEHLPAIEAWIQRENNATT